MPERAIWPRAHAAWTNPGFALLAQCCHTLPRGVLHGVATIDPEGYVKITDRTKDLVKSGGEWISTVDLENALMGHPAVAQAAVIAAKHPKWDERPVAIVVLKQGTAVTAGELR
ncbi:MAG TPA: hypothetical protein VH642_04250, partial [Streptosporangiaceae bacterium]